MIEKCRTSGTNEGKSFDVMQHGSSCLPNASELDEASINGSSVLKSANNGKNIKLKIDTQNVKGGNESPTSMEANPRPSDAESNDIANNKAKQSKKAKIAQNDDKNDPNNARNPNAPPVQTPNNKLRFLLSSCIFICFV